VRIEAVPDDSFPKGGPGRGAAGAFLVSRLSLALVTPGRSAVQGRYVRIERAMVQKKYGPPLALEEVQVVSGGRNIAAEGHATQSSTEGRATADRALNGEIQGKRGKDSFARTKSSDNEPWWQVDMGRARPIERVVVWHHDEGAAARPANLYQLKILDDKQKTVWESLIDPMRAHGPYAVCDETLLTENAETRLRLTEGRRRAPEPRPGVEARYTPWAGRLGVASSAIYAADQTVDPRGKTLVFSVEHFSPQRECLLGRFRISVTGEKPPFAPEPMGVEVPLLPE
jgi:hypothetical protein